MLHFCPYYGIDALMVDCPLLVVAFITDQVRSTKEGDVIGNIFSLFVCSQGPSGVPHGIWTQAVPWYLVLGPFLGSDGGAPDLVQVAGRRYPSQDQDRKPPGSGQGTPRPPPPRGPAPGQQRLCHRQDTPQVVCILWSRRKTFLFHSCM